ncbi:unnamed protein product [Rotaria magnacalcarata]|uniref:VLIG-type G domain-containing protein n=1 Tax=Rotaria magnacalcarata TaxID=392030 RepID=A0A816SDD1_9BILA|nr:unnamed protein product [Rotaria magnacalcarata]CAF3845091.1 unnamed protein product [Rotaria magnacalcarata]
MEREDSSASFQVSSSHTSLTSENPNLMNSNKAEIDTLSSLKPLENEYPKKIIELLDLDDSSESKIIAEQLMIKGRQALKEYKDDIACNIFRKQMSSEKSELLEILKDYVQQQWHEIITEEWFLKFLEEQKLQSAELYDQILTRSAEYGSKFIKDNALLSLTLQFIFEFRDETMENDGLFDSIWSTLITKGLEGLQDFKDDIAVNVLEEQLENDQSPLIMALRSYFEKPLKDLFKQQEVNINRLDIFEKALGCAVRNGWWEGLHNKKVTDYIARNKFNKLIEKLKEYFNSQELPIPAEYISINILDNKIDNAANLNSTPNASMLTDTRVMTTTSDSLIDESAIASSNTSNNDNSNHNALPSSTVIVKTDDLRQQRARECKRITLCINEHKKLQLSDLVEAGELSYIEKKLDQVLDNIIDDYRCERNFSSFIKACLTPIMYLLKRHQNLDDFTESLFYKYSQVDSSLQESNLSLRMILHVLLLNSDLSLFRKIMSLLSKRNPVPFVQPALTNDKTSYQFISDIIHVWDYSIPTVLSFGIGPCHGKSTIINSIFFSSFEQSMPSIYFENTIDIDFGYNFLPRRLTNIADTHGPMMKTLLEQIHELFDGFLIHVDYLFLLNNNDCIDDFLNVIKTDSKYRLMIVRDVPRDQHNQCNTLLSSKFSGIDIFILPDIADQNKKENKHFILTLRDKIWEKLPSKCCHHIDYLKNELRYLMDDEYKNRLNQMYTIIVPLQQAFIKTATDESMVRQYFPEYLNFVELCELQLKLARFNFYGNENDNVVNDVRCKIFQCKSYNEIVSQEPSLIYKLFRKVLETRNMLTCLELLTDELKQDRVKLVSTTDMAKQLPIQQSLSLEVLWRNAIVCIQRASEHDQKYLQKQYYEYIKAGFPFEIVDGDNFYFQYSFLVNALEPFRDHRTLVISVIGPQNSGKSTLLNYMFGSLFDVRDGRCTRGIYGSLVKTNRTDFEYIMLIDTEGLLGVEREDPEYDRRIVLFCLAVSHLVIVNMVGEVSTTLQTMLTLCTDSLEKIGVTRIPQPIVHFILNQKADLNIENNQAAIDRIISDLKKFGLGQSIEIRKETFHTLPSAFKKEGHTVASNSKLPNAIKTSPEFIECVQLLCGEIIRSAEPCLDRANEFFDPLQWLSSSNTIFDTLQKFSDLTYYRDIHERRLDNELREHIRNDLTKIFSVDYRDELIVESSHNSEQEVNQLFLVKQNKIQETARENVEKLFKLLKVPDTLRQRSRQFIMVQITEMFNALRTSTIAANEREKVKLIVRNGEGDLQKLIEDTIQSGQQMSSDVASQKFDQMFNNTIQHIEKKFVPKDRLDQAIKHIYTNYSIYEKECLLEYPYITNHHPLLSAINHRQASIAQVEDEVIMHFTNVGYRDSSFTAYNFNPTTHYSLDIIKNLVYLSKELLEREFLTFVDHTSPYVDKHQRKDGDRHKNKTFIQRGVSYVVSALSGNKDDKQVQQSSVTSPDQFQLKIRNAILNQKPMLLNRTSVDECHMYFGTSKVFKEIFVRIVKTMNGVGNDKLRQIRTELIQKIVGLINSLIIDVDNELAPFCLSLSRPLKSTFHTCAIVLLTKYYYDEQINHFTQTLSTLQAKKSDLKKYFISMVVSNASVDENYAINLGKQFKEHLLKLFTDEGQQIINIELKNYDRLNRKWIQDCCDGQLLTHNDTRWHLDYIENPTKIIEELFNQLWSNVQKLIDQKLNDRKSFYLNILIEFFYIIQGILDTVTRFGAAAKFVNDILISAETNSLDANENLINKKHCMAILFFEFFTQQAIPTLLTNNGKEYNLKLDVLSAFQLLIKQRKPSAHLSAIVQSLAAINKKIYIGNFFTFLQTLLKEKDKLLDDLNRCKSDFKSIDTQDTYTCLLDKVRGCPDLCPCCKRPCDVDHTQVKSKPGSEYNEHRCLSGHTLRAMNGYKFEVTEEASLLMCEQIKDDQVIVIGPMRYQWSQFKKNHPNWVFDSTMNDDELNRLHGKFLTVWQRIGPHLCEKFQIKYVTHNTAQKIVPEPFHYILLLDGSGSMKGEKWNDLMKAVKEFLKLRNALKVQDRITIIVFSERTEIVYSDERIQDINVDRILYHGGGTSFHFAFECVNKCITQTKQKILPNSVYANCAIIFMSDGAAPYPENELNLILNDYDTIIKRFWTFALVDDMIIKRLGTTSLANNQSSSMQTLEQINEKMKGSFFDIKASTDLVRAYAEVATIDTSIQNQ